MKVGDLVSFLDESGEGEIIDIDGNTILVDVQGFQKSYDISEIIKREQGFENKIINSQVINKDVSVSTKVKRAIDSEVFVVDLHASAIPNFRNQLKGHNILLFQMETAKNHLESARKNRLKKMIFIHGNGSGTLKYQLEQWLNSLSYISYQDASYKSYGQGAIEVKLYNSK
jgi:ASC-1-like (ASCH) protein